MHRRTQGKFIAGVTGEYPAWDAGRRKGFLAPRVYSPDLPISMKDNVMKAEVLYELATEKLQAENEIFLVENKRFQEELDRETETLPVSILTVPKDNLKHRLESISS